MELIASGAGAGIALQALLGLALTFTRAARYPVAFVSGMATVAAAIYLWRKGIFRELQRDLSRPIRAALAIWMLFAISCVAVTHLIVALPAALPDGRYIFKQNTLNVRLQYLTTLPADNFLPYAVTEFFLRRISFRAEHPLLPGQEVGNRTILMSLVALPYRATLAMPPRAKHPLPRFSYVQSEWPDVSAIYREDYYRQMLVVGIFLNSLLLLGLIAVFSAAGRNRWILPWAATLYLTNPFLLTQTIFIWPKALAGFFLLLAWQALRRRSHPALVGAWAALACHSHPLAGIFSLGLGAFYLVRVWRGRATIREAVLFDVSLSLLLAPWFLWTKFYLQLPSDLLWQNVAGAGTELALSSALNFVWVRFWNFFQLLAPMMFFVYPFDAAAIVEAVQNCLPGAVGIFLIVPAWLETARTLRPKSFLWCAVAGPLLGIVVLFSFPALPLLHGFQVAVGGLIFFGVIALARRGSPVFFWTVCSLQLASNLCLLGLRAHVTGLHFP